MVITMKKTVLFLLVIFLVIGVCGCMSSKLNLNEYKNAILSFLQEKYDSDFLIKNIYQEFDGNSGMVVRAVCSNVDSSDEFTVFCYLDSTVGSDVCEIDGNEHSISEDYTAVIFQKEILSMLNDVSTSRTLLKCNLDFLGRNPTTDEFQTGLLSCLQNEELNACVKFYILSDDNDISKEMRDSIEILLEIINPSTGYIYFLVTSSFNETELNNIYAENQHDFGNYLTNGTLGEFLEFSLYKKDKGLEERRVIRG